MKQYKTFSAAETKKVAQSLAKDFKVGIIALTGKLGAGKTTFVQGFAKGLGSKEKIISPTFFLIRQHPIPKTLKTLYHIDLYRLKESKDLQILGLKEICSNPDNIVLIEWGEKAKNLLPKDTLWIKFENLGENKRGISLL